MPRPRKPAALHLLRGTYRADRHGPDPSRIASELPPTPAHLVGHALQEWRRLAALAGPSGLRVLTPADAGALEAAAVAYATARRAQAVLDRRGLTYGTRTPSGSELRRPRPEVSIAAEAWARYSRLLSLFGLTPADRAKAAVAAEEPAGKLAAFTRGTR